MAVGGRAWVGLIRRTEGLDPQTVLDRAAAAPEDVDGFAAAVATAVGPT